MFKSKSKEDKKKSLEKVAGSLVKKKAKTSEPSRRMESDYWGKKSNSTAISALRAGSNLHHIVKGDQFMEPTQDQAEKKYAKQLKKIRKEKHLKA